MPEVGGLIWIMSKVSLERWLRPWRELAALPRPLWLLFWSTLMNRAGTMALPFLVIYLTGRRGLSSGQAGLMLTVYGAGALLVKPYGGWLADRWGAIPVMLFSLLSSGALLLAYPAAVGLRSIAALTLLWALLNEVFRPASLTAIGAFTSPERRRSAYVLNRLAINIGTTLGPALGGLLASRSFKALFWVDGITSLAAGALLWLWFPQESRPRLRQAARAGSAASSYLAVLADARMRYFVLALLPVGLVFFQHVSSLSLFMVRDLRLPASWYGLLFTINGVLIISLEVPLNSLAARWPRRRALVLGCALFAAGFGALAFARTGAHIVATLVVWTFGEMLLFASMAAYVADIASESRRGSYMAVFLGALDIAFLSGPWLGIRVLDTLGPRVLWGSCLALGVLSAALMSGVAEQERGVPAVDPSLEPAAA